MYLDSCIWVKIYTREPDTEFFGRLVDGQPLSSSGLAYTEVWAALLAKERSGALSAKDRGRAWAAFARNVEEEVIQLAPLSSAILKRANRIMELCHPAVPLRSLDAIHLSACDQLQDWPLCTTDNRMRQAAAILGYPLCATS